MRGVDLFFWLYWNLFVLVRQSLSYMKSDSCGFGKLAKPMKSCVNVFIAFSMLKLVYCVHGFCVSQQGTFSLSVLTTRILTIQKIYVLPYYGNDVLTKHVIQIYWSLIGQLPFSETKNQQSWETYTKNSHKKWLHTGQRYRHSRPLQKMCSSR